MGIGGKARHIQADLCHDHVRGDVTDAVYRAQKPGALLDRRQGFPHAGKYQQAVRSQPTEGLSQTKRSVAARLVLVLGGRVQNPTQETQ
jgi:hypothetical protein